MSVTLARILEEVRELTPEERRELEVALQRLDDLPPRPPAEVQLIKKMAAEKNLAPATRALSKAAPVSSTGKPVSEMISEDRR